LREAADDAIPVSVLAGNSDSEVASRSLG